MPAPPPATPPVVTVPRGAIAACDPRTAEAGAEMLRRGGNAADAAVAANFAAGVVEFSLTGIGGSGIATLHLPPAPEAGAPARDVAYDFFSTMPGLGADPRRHLDPARIDFRPVAIDFGSAVQTVMAGLASVAVPGLVAGLGHIHARHGRLPWADVLEPAIRLAREPLFLSPIMQEVAEMIEPLVLLSGESRRIFSPRGRFVQDPEGIVQPELAATLERLAADGAAAFYRGAIADRIVADGAEHGGLITAEDLATYEVLELEPWRVAYGDRVVLLPPGPSWGGRLIAFTLALLNVAPLAATTFRSLDHAVLLAEAMCWTQRRRRETHPDLDRLADPDLLDATRRLFLETATERARLARTAPPLASGPPNTSHISVVDADGMAVAITSSTGFGSGMAIRGLGVLANNMLGEPDLNPLGYHALAPGARMSTMMAPCIVERGGEVDLVLGSAGANRLRSAIVQTIIHHVDFGCDVNEAVNLPRLHFEDDLLHVEASDDPDLVAALGAAGYDVKAWPSKSLFFGGCNAVSRGVGAPPAAAASGRASSGEHRGIAGHDPNAPGELRAAGDRRREGAAIIV